MSMSTVSSTPSPCTMAMAASVARTLFSSGTGWPALHNRETRQGPPRIPIFGDDKPLIDAAAQHGGGGFGHAPSGFADGQHPQPASVQTQTGQGPANHMLWLAANAARITLCASSLSVLMACLPYARCAEPPDYFSV